MSLEVWAELSSNTLQCQISLLYLRILCLNIHHCFAHIINEHLLLVSYMSKQDGVDNAVKYGQVHVEFFTEFGTTQNRWFSKIAFDYLKCLLIFVCPTEHACPLKCEEEMSQLICEMSYETSQSCETTYEALQFPFATQNGRFKDDLHLSWINFTSPLGYHIPQKLPYTDVEGIISQILLHVVCLHQMKCLFQVLNVHNLGFVLYENVINVDFHSSINQGLEDFCHQPLVGSVSILESKPWCDNTVFVV